VGRWWLDFGLCGSWTLSPVLSLPALSPAVFRLGLLSQIKCLRTLRVGRRMVSIKAFSVVGTETKPFQSAHGAAPILSADNSKAVKLTAGE